MKRPSLPLEERLKTGEYGRGGWRSALSRSFGPPSPEWGARNPEPEESAPRGRVGSGTGVEQYFSMRAERKDDLGGDRKWAVDGVDKDL